MTRVRSCLAVAFSLYLEVSSTSLQATIGIDFLSKTMYLEDRTVSDEFFPVCLLYVMRSAWDDAGNLGQLKIHL